MQIDIGTASLVLGLVLTSINLWKEFRKPSLERDKETKDYRRYIEQEIARLQADIEELKATTANQEIRLRGAEGILSDMFEGIVKLSRHAVDGNHIDQLSDYAERMEKRLYERK